MTMKESEIPSEKDLSTTKQAYEFWKNQTKHLHGVMPEVTYDEWFEIWMESGKYFERKSEVDADVAHYVLRVVDGNAPLVADNFVVKQTKDGYLEESTPVVNDLISDAYVEETE